MNFYENSRPHKDQTMVDYQTVSSKCSLKVVERSERLHEWLKLEEIELLHKIFLAKEKLTYVELRDELENLNITFTDLEYNRLFLKINQNRDFKCDWNEFISYLMLGFEEDDPASQKESLILPISSAPFVRKSEHRSPVCAISLLKNVSDLIGDEKGEDGKHGEELDELSEEEENEIKNVTTDDAPENKGIWITASKEGQIRFWTSHLQPLRSGISESYHQKMATWILCIQALSDVSIVCTSSTERELRFHEAMSSAFTLRIVIRSMPFAVCQMAYSFHPKSKTNSCLVLGDYAGNVWILQFSSILRGPFQSKPGAALITVLWRDILKGKLPLFKPKEYFNIHSEMIQHLFFSIRLNSLFAAAEYRNTKKYRVRCPGLILVNGDEKTTFRIPLGVTTFCVDEKNSIVVTGGPDTFVRIWDIYVYREPSGILTGHNGGIVMIFVQPDAKKIYSVDYQKIIKVWDLKEHVLLQTFSDLARLIPGENALSFYYHVYLRTLLVGGRKLVAIKCNPPIRVDLTDGNTHAAPVSVVLYNRLFRNVVTCGLDSFIIVWDPWTGRRKVIIKNCHTKQLYGEKVDIEITAACFDPLEQFLLTGARDGSLKIWNYNNAVCIRNMSIRPEHAVTAVMWVVERILAAGWDQQVTEFNDSEGREYADPKKWSVFHTEDITCADVKLGEGIVTATYSGELIFWKLETGQPYRRYSVANPEEFIELKHLTPHSVMENNEIEESQRVSSMNVSRFVRRSISETIRETIYKEMSMWQIPDVADAKPDVNEPKLSLQSEASQSEMLPMSVQAVLFLQSRPMTTEHGSVFVALETGVIQVYSHHQRGGYIKQFNAIHKTGDCVLTMATDRKNRYLFTGTAMGYVKIWHIRNYCIPEKEKVKLSMPLLRLQFIFLRHDRFLTRAKRAVRYQQEPKLVSSYKGHLKAINSIAFINLPKILITGSHDCSCRLWSLGGRYLGTLGTPLPWNKLSPFEPVEELNIHYRMPPDIKKVASSTTIKVITGEQNDYNKIVSKDVRQEDIDTIEDDETLHMFGKPLRSPILGKHFELPGRSGLEQHINVEITAPYIPVFTHLKIHEASSLERPCTPPIIQRLARESYMDFYKTNKTEHSRAEYDVTKAKQVLQPDRKSIPKSAIVFVSNDTQNE